ncbi:MAG: hypothetical protein P4L93_03335 [Coriobacteriia bacterium]|nr:hypothetical protein [Coriobacteriia bacterium]
MPNAGNNWDTRMPEIRKSLKARGIVAFPSHETHSLVVMPTDGRAVVEGQPDWEHVFSAPEVFISEDELAAEDYKEIVLRKVTAALGRLPQG